MRFVMLSVEDDGDVDEGRRNEVHMKDKSTHEMNMNEAKKDETLCGRFSTGMRDA